MKIALAVFLVFLAWWLWPAPDRARAERDEVVAAPEAAKGERPAAPAKAPIGSRPAAAAHDRKCTLDLALYDNGAAVAGVVHLYRLDLPEDDVWTSGDVLERTVSVPRDGATVEGLPAGRYRPHCPGQRHPGLELPPFRVEGARTPHAVAVAMPRSFDAWLVVRDEDGRPIPTGTLRSSFGKPVVREFRPVWFEPRRPKAPSHFPLALAGGAGGSPRGRLGSRRRTAQAVDGRFHLGCYREDDGTRKMSVRCIWHAEGRSAVVASFDLEEWRETTFAGRSVPLAPIRRSIFLPGGAPASGADVSAWSEAHPDGVRRPLQVTVSLDGYEPLTFVLAPGEDPPPRTLAADR